MQYTDTVAQELSLDRKGEIFESPEVIQDTLALFLFIIAPDYAMGSAIKHVKNIGLTPPPKKKSS